MLRPWHGIFRFSRVFFDEQAEAESRVHAAMLRDEILTAVMFWSRGRVGRDAMFWCGGTLLLPCSGCHPEDLDPNTDMLYF
jgi:hypothetical protein